MARVAANSSSLLLTVLLLACASGCGGASGDGFKGDRGQVKGRVTLDGKGIQSGCQVIFMSTTGGYTASGVITEDGAYTLSYSDKAGIPAVEYAVQLTAPIATAPTQTVDPTKMAENMKLSRKGAGAKDEGPFPSKYASTTSSKLKFTVKAGENTADFVLDK